MSIESLYADRIEEAIQRQLRNPGPAPAPESFSAWGVITSLGKAPVQGGLEQTGSILDFLSPFGATAAASGGTGQGMFSVPTADEKKQEDDARKRMLSGDTFDASAGNELRRKAEEFAPNPQTTHTANQVVHSVIRGATKLVLDAATLGPVPGAVLFGADEGNTAAQKLIEQGVDPATAAKVGVTTGVVQGAAAAIPIVGSTIGKTIGLAAAGGPISYMAQEKATKEILQRANYPELAAQHDPLDPLGLALSIGIPGAVAGLHIRGLKKPTELADVVKHIESGGNRFDENGNLLTSPKGAQGEMQVMPKTATDPGFGVVPAKDNSPAELARVGRDYLRAMQQRYGDTDKALAAYNAGPGAVDNAIKAHGDDWLAHLPDETQKYVAKANKLMGDHIADKGAADPAVVDAARVKVLDSTLKDLPMHPEAHAELMRAIDDVGAGRMPVVQEPPRDLKTEDLRGMAQQAYWAQQGGSIIREGAPLDTNASIAEARWAFQEGAVVGRTKWIPAAEWYGAMRSELGKAGLTSQKEIAAAVEKFIAGEPLTAKEQRTVDWMHAEVERVHAAARDMGVEHPADFADAIGAAGLSHKDVPDAVLVARASSLDEAAVERAAIAHEYDDAAFMAAIQRIVDERQSETGQPSRSPAASRPRVQQAEDGAGSALPEEASVTLEPASAGKSSTDASQGVDQSRLKALLEEQPHLEDAILRAHEAYDEEVHLADLVKVAVECALANGG